MWEHRLIEPLNRHRPILSSLTRGCSSSSSCRLCRSISCLSPDASSSYPATVLSTTAKISSAAVVSFSATTPLSISALDMLLEPAALSASIVSEDLAPHHRRTEVWLPVENYAGMFGADVALVQARMSSGSKQPRRSDTSLRSTEDGAKEIMIIITITILRSTFHKQLTKLSL